jgi:hypothetical protein
MGYLAYFDLVESLIVSSYGGPQDAEQRDIRSAILKAYNEVTTIRDWSHYQSHGRVITDAPYQTGTVSYNTSTRELTLTGGTWPTWATFGHVRIGTRIAVVSARTSSTVLTLDAGVTFPETITSQPYVLYRLLYPLPADFRNLDEPTSEYNWSSGLYVSPDEALKIERVARSTGLPYHWTVLPNPNGSGWVIKLLGYPTRVETVDFMYRRTARPLKYSGHEANSRAGTIARTGDAVTLSGATTFVSGFVGSILRVGDTSLHPGPAESLNPWVSESEITAVGSTTSLTTADSGTIASSTKYLITDPCDIAPHMQPVLDAACQYYLARIRGKDEDKKFQLYQRDLRLALERDQLAPLSGRTRHIYTDGGWRSPLKVDGGL